VVNGVNGVRLLDRIKESDPSKESDPLEGV
jgi:hypothetical protein